ncbi:hypothetical protein WJX72_004499 [[Myrmecia] bisecta]|uniref:Plastid lipid-associated protein/fibrillin conserved domain-containing protein n=1 Tax=[Myrmecia] bisecta TaxID=41462 RepID=A0AAW1Q0R3_9CHLO
MQLNNVRPLEARPRASQQPLPGRPACSLPCLQRRSRAGHDRRMLTTRAAYSPGGNPDELVVKGEVGNPADTISGTRAVPAEQLVKADVGKPEETPQLNPNKVPTNKKSTKATGTKATATKATARKQASRGAETAKETVEEGADAVQRAAGGTSRQLRDGIEDASEAVQEGIDNVEEGIEEAIDDAPKEVRDAVQSGVDTAADVVDDVREALDDAPEPREMAQAAVDGMADAINSAKSTAQSALQPGPSAPYQSTPLTSLPAYPPASDEEGSKGAYFKTRLLYSIAGLDRGFAANTEAANMVEDAVSALVSASEPVSLAWTAQEGQAQSTLAQLNGTWRLLYSSAFTTGSLGGKQPGPSVVGSPFALGQVYQAISAYTARLDNIVELYSRINLPALPGMPKVPPVVVTASLKHNFEALGGSTCQITFEDVEVKATGGLGGVLGNLPEFSLPQLPEPFRPSKQQRTSLFDLLYLDDDMRITRGSRGELRIFTRT